MNLDTPVPLRIKSVYGNKFGLLFIDHYTNTPFAYAMKTKDEYQKYLNQFLIDFRGLFRGLRFCEIRVLRFNNASEFISAEVKQIYLDHSIEHHLANPEQQFQNENAETCIGDVWTMTKALLFSNVPRLLWEEAWRHTSAVKRHLPSAANEGSPLQISTKW